MDLARQAAGIGALADPTRRALYEYVAGAGEPVGREQAATALGLAVSTAGFHLEKLVAEGLLETEHRRLTGRTGPGAGRPTKLYRRSPEQFEVTLPQRRYDLVGEILAAAFDRAATGADPDVALAESARTEGLDLGRQARAAGSPADPGALARVLASQGYEPRHVPPDPAPGDVPADSSRAACLELANCPFDSLARRHTALVCGLNRHYVQGVVDGLGAEDTQAHLDPAPDRCCVTVTSGGAAPEDQDP